MSTMLGDCTRVPISYYPTDQKEGNVLYYLCNQQLLIGANGCQYRAIS